MAEQRCGIFVIVLAFPDSRKLGGTYADPMSAQRELWTQILWHGTATANISCPGQEHEMKNSNHPDHPAASPLDKRAEALRAEIARLADLSPIAYEFERSEIAETFGIRSNALDRLVAAARQDKTGSQQLRDDEPWPEPVKLKDVLDEILAIQRRYIVGNPIQLDVVPLWIAHTYLVHHDRINLQISPRLAVQSADKNSGKTTVLEFVRYFCPRAIMLSSASAAGVYHLAQQRVTIMLDEIEQLRAGSPLHHIINGSHRRADSNILRADFSGGAGKARVSNAWGAVALGGIGQLPGTLQSRCIPVNMRPAMPHEVLEWLNGEPVEAANVRRKLARWAADLTELPQFDLPRGIINRSADNWRALAQIAHLAGPEWVLRVERAALHAEQQVRPSITVMLLEATRRALGDRNQITTRDLLFSLLHDEEYADQFQIANRGRPITECWLRERYVGLISNPDRSVKVQGGRGYTHSQFVGAFQTYLEPMPEASAADQLEDQPQAAAPEDEPTPRTESKKPKRKTGNLKLVVPPNTKRKEIAEPAPVTEAAERHSSAPSALTADGPGETGEQQGVKQVSLPLQDRSVDGADESR
jgi:hypothetical protein